MKVSLIITTYNWPQALAVTLASVLRQTYAGFDMVIADDGSSSRTTDTIREVLANATMPWCHVRHQDQGIRQARIKNLAVQHAGGDYFIFIDHDVMLHPEFIADHITHTTPDCFLQGKRVFLSEALTHQYFEQGRQDFPTPFAMGIENRKNGFRAPGLARWINRKKQFQVSLRGCNLSMSRSTFMAVDGYDERFDGLWGREDSDICYRMFHNNIRIKNLWLAALQYHLHHPSIKRRGRDRLDEELAICLREKRRTAIHGYSKLSTEGEVVSKHPGDRH